MLSVDDFAQVKGCSSRTVRRWLREKRIAGAYEVLTECGKKWQIPANAAVNRPTRGRPRENQTDQ